MDAKPSIRQPPTSKATRTRWAIALVIGIPVLIASVSVWPIAYLPEGICLTGHNVSLKRVYYGRDPGREGYSTEVNRISPADCQLLQQNGAKLAMYPMWCPGAVMDGYQQASWQSLADLRNGPHADIVNRALKGGYDIEPESVKTIGDAIGLATHLSKRPEALVSGHFGSASYTIYVLDLERGILVRITLLT